MKINRYKLTIASVDAINIYPLIKLLRIKKSVSFFARKLTAETKENINLCLDLTLFGMNSTLIYFNGE